MDFIKMQRETEPLVEKYQYFIDWVKPQMSEKRFVHSMGVAELAVYFAKKIGANVDDCFVAGVCHDIAKDLPKEEQKALLQASAFVTDLEIMNHDPLWHAIAGALILKKHIKEYPCITLNVVSATFRHTLGRKDMSKEEECVFLADMIEKNRSWDGADKLRAVAERDFYAGMALAFKMTIDYQTQNNKYLHPVAWDCFEQYAEYLPKEEN
ncbi:MAG: bis(5'-nucleosyl)-tetraphosphatase (symmetrical) YqeK [Bacillota bacterium]